MIQVRDGPDERNGREGQARQNHGRAESQVPALEFFDEYGAYYQGYGGCQHEGDVHPFLVNEAHDDRDEHEACENDEDDPQVRENGLPVHNL